MIGSLPPGWWGIVIAAIGILFPFIVGWRRGRIDESALILGRWKDMVDQHAEDIKELRDELRREREDNAKLRETVAAMSARHTEEMAAMSARHAEELAKRDEKIHELEQSVIVLQRKLSQQGESVANVLGDVLSPDDKEIGIAISREIAKRRRKKS